MKRVTVCLFCRYFVRSDHYKCWFCKKHYHPAEPDDRCTFGKEKDE